MKHILIVDDHDDNLYFLRVLLEGRGYAVAQARNGSEAMDKALAGIPDMIISDILMPVMDGFTLCKKLKADERLKHIPFLFYTATYTDPRDEKLACDMGAEAFIVKPTEPAEFLKRIEPILQAGKNGNLISPQIKTIDEEVVLREYNEALIRKLEQKMLKLEEVNKTLEAEISDRKQAEVQREAALEEIRKLNEDLEKRIGERTAELRNTIAQLEDLNRVFVGRELKMMELKERIAELEKA